MGHMDDGNTNRRVGMKNDWVMYLPLEKVIIPVILKL